MIFILEPEEAFQDITTILNICMQFKHAYFHYKNQVSRLQPSIPETGRICPHRPSPHAPHCLWLFLLHLSGTGLHRRMLGAF